MPVLTEAWIRSHSTLPTGSERERHFDDHLPGFGVVVGRRSVMFVVRHRLKGKQCDRTIGQWQRPGAGDDHSESWTEPRARKRARQWLGMMDNGLDPYEQGQTARKRTESGPTLRDAFELHKKHLLKQKRSDQTLSTFERSMKYVEDWLDRPISDLRGSVLVELHDQIKRDARPTAGAVNEKGAALANRVITNIGTAWGALNKSLEGRLGNWNPAASVVKDKLDSKDVTVADLADWHRRVQTMRNPIQRDALMFALFTGLRDGDVKTARIESVDLDAKVLRLVDPKGGKAKAFTIPLPQTCIEIIERRIADNTEDLGRDEGDSGWIFPGINSEGAIGPIGDLRQQVHTENGHSRFPAEPPHMLRHTYLTVAHEAGVEKMDRQALANHSFAGRDVHESYISTHLDHLRKCQNRIETTLKSKLSPKPDEPKKRSRHLKSVAT